MFFTELHKLITETTHFDIYDLFTVGTLALLEGILSVDNALVLAILVKDLPKKIRRRALTWGMWGAFIFRLLAVIFATLIMKFWFVKLIGGGYLIFLSMKHMYLIGQNPNTQGSNKEKKQKDINFWHAVLLVELTDIIFSLDSITTAVAITDKILIIWLGGILGIVFMRLLSGVFVTLLEKFPRAEELAYQLVFFVGTKLALESLGIEFEHKVLWIMIGVLAVIGGSLLYKDYMLTKKAGKITQKLIDDIMSGDVTFEEMLEKEEIINTEIIKHLIRIKYLCITSKTKRLALKKLMEGEGQELVQESGITS